MGELSYKSPLYLQLREVIRSKIEEEEYLPGTAIPSENQLMELYGLNRQSVRSALAALEYEGLLKSVQGKGVFVAGAKTERDLETLGGYRTTMRERDRTPSTKVLVKALRTAGPYYARLLELDPQEEVWFIRRVDCADREAVALEEIYIPRRVLPGLDEVDIQLFSIYDVYLWNGIQPSEGRQTLRIVRLSPQRGKLIGVQPRQAVMEFSCVTRDTGGRVIEFARNYVRNDKAEFGVRFSNHGLV